MDEERAYLVATLIENGDEAPTDMHELYRSREAAMRAMRRAIRHGMEGFEPEAGRLVTDLPTVWEWRDLEGHALTVTVEVLCLS